MSDVAAVGDKPPRGLSEDVAPRSSWPSLTPHYDSAAARLLEFPMAGLYPIDIEDANRFLTAVGHKLGPCNRPFRQEAYGLEVDGRLVSVAISASIVSASVGDYERQQVVELARLGASVPWANRVMLRLWRELCGPRWKSWPVKAVVSYSTNSMHRGDLYRFDGWEKIREDAGSDSRGGRWGAAWAKGLEDPTRGKKTLWIYRYETDERRKSHAT